MKYTDWESEWKYRLFHFWKRTSAGHHRLELLQEFVDARMDFPAPTTYESRRVPIYDSNYNKPDCFVCDSGCNQLHHIIPVSQHGPRNKYNLVPLCERCHKKLHPHLGYLNATDDWHYRGRKTDTKPWSYRQ